MRSAILQLPAQRTSNEQRQVLRQLRMDVGGVKGHLATLRAGTTS